MQSMQFDFVSAHARIPVPSPKQQTQSTAASILSLAILNTHVAKNNVKNIAVPPQLLSSAAATSSKPSSPLLLSLADLTAIAHRFTFEYLVLDHAHVCCVCTLAHDDLLPVLQPSAAAAAGTAASQATSTTCTGTTPATPTAFSILTISSLIPSPAKAVAATAAGT
jgi:hypothetical protein